MDHKKKIKIILIFKILIFNLFLFGFLINLVAYLNTYWIVSGENYIIGLFQYCKLFNQVEVNSKNNNASNLIYSKKVFKCFNWTNMNRPKFLKLSVIFHSSALCLHLVTLSGLIAVILIYNFLKSKKNSNIYDNQASIYRINYKKEILAYIFISGLGFFLISLYGSNLITLFINHFLNTKQQTSWSWCFWVHLTGCILTLISICLFFIYTIYFKMLNFDDSFNQDSASESSFNELNDLNVPTTSFNPLFLTNQTTNDYQNIFELDLTQIQKIKRENSFKQSNKKRLDQKRTAPTAYSQVYPVTKKKKKLNHGTKMVALPYGSLSGINLTK